MVEYSILGGLKSHAIEPGNGEARGAIRAGFEAHPHDRWGLVVLLPVVGELLLKHLEEVHVVGLHRPGAATPQGNVLDVGIDTL